MVALKKKLEEAQKFKDQAKKPRAKAKEAKVEAEKARDKVEQHGYDVGVAETEYTLQAQVPTVCRTYCA